MADYVLGLDWLNVEHGWACCQLPTGVGSEHTII
jgi:hypothetical protein